VPGDLRAGGFGHSVHRPGRRDCARQRHPYGLAAGLFTNDLKTAFRAARALRFGGVHINEASSARVDVMPFGGVKDSGFGREGPAYAIREMTEERLVTIAY